MVDTVRSTTTSGNVKGAYLIDEAFFLSIFDAIEKVIPERSDKYGRERLREISVTQTMADGTKHIAGRDDYNKLYFTEMASTRSLEIEGRLPEHTVSITLRPITGTGIYYYVSTPSHESSNIAEYDLNIAIKSSKTFYSWVREKSPFLNLFIVSTIFVLVAQVIAVTLYDQKLDYPWPLILFGAVLMFVDFNKDKFFPPLLFAVGAAKKRMDQRLAVMKAVYAVIGGAISIAGGLSGLGWIVELFHK